MIRTERRHSKKTAKAWVSRANVDMHRILMRWTTGSKSGECALRWGT